MYDPNDEKTVLSIDEIRSVFGPDSWMGYVEKSYLLPWVHPANITGMDFERLSRVNRARNYAVWFENELGIDSEKLQDPDYEDDDDLVRNYLECVASQHRALSKKHPDVGPISGVRHFAALLYMATHWESATFALPTVDRAGMTREEIQECLALYEAAFTETPHCHVKLGLPDAVDGFFCNDFFPPEAQNLPEFRRFLDDPDNIARLTQLRARFDQDCPELAARIARENEEAAEASALLDAVRDKADHDSHMPEGNPLYWSLEERSIFYFDWAVKNWFETRWLERARAGKKSLFRWRLRLAVWPGLPKKAPISDELIDSLAEFTSDADALYYLFRHLDEGGEKYSNATKRTLARIRELKPLAG